MPHLLLAGLILLPLAWAPFFDDPYTVTKWILIYSLTAGTAAHLIRSPKQLSGLHIPPAISALFTGALIWFVFQLARTRSWDFQLPLLDRLSFVILTLAFAAEALSSRKFVSRVADALRFSGLVVAGIGIIQFLAQPGGSGFSYFAYASTFGHVNLAAQFVGLGLLAQIYRLSQSKIQRLALAIMTFYICISLCRSVWIASAAGSLLYFALCNRVIISKRILARSGAALLGLALIIFGGLRFQGNTWLPLLEKSQNSSYRIEMWADTLRMIADYPLGVGPGNFESAYIPYKIGGESWPTLNTLDRSPHNEYLRWLSEDGIPFILLAGGLFILLFALGLRCFRDEPAESNRERAWLGGNLVYLAMDAVFQSPIQNPAPILVLSALTGACLARISFRQAETISWKVPLKLYRTGGVIALALTVVLSGRLIYTQLAIGSFNDDYKMITRSCEFSPSLWKGCVLKSVIEMESGEPQKARETLRPLLIRAPYFFPVVRAHAAASYDAGEISESCALAWAYDEILDHNTADTGEETGARWLFTRRCQLPDVRENFMKHPILDLYPRLR